MSHSRDKKEIHMLAYSCIMPHQPVSKLYITFESRLYSFSIISIDKIARFSEQVYCTVLYFSPVILRTHSPMGDYSFDWNT